MTDAQLKIALSKMLPEKLAFDDSFSIKDCEPRLRWLYDSSTHAYRRDLGVIDTELLHVCWLIEETLSDGEWNDYGSYIDSQVHSVFCDRHRIHATWQQRATALAKVKGVEL